MNRFTARAVSLGYLALAVLIGTCAMVTTSIEPPLSEATDPARNSGPVAFSFNLDLHYMGGHYSRRHNYDKDIARWRRLVTECLYDVGFSSVSDPPPGDVPAAQHLSVKLAPHPNTLSEFLPYTLFVLWLIPVWPSIPAYTVDAILYTDGKPSAEVHRVIWHREIVHLFLLPVALPSRLFLPFEDDRLREVIMSVFAGPQAASDSRGSH